MSKNVFIFTVLLVPSIVAASDYNYGVSGYGDQGYVYGDIDANRGSRDVDGYIYDENGDAKYFSGEWSGRGEVEGYDEDGNYIQLEVD
jgi:hypothetical protein